MTSCRRTVGRLLKVLLNISERMLSIKVIIVFFCYSVELICSMREILDAIPKVLAVHVSVEPENAC